MSFFNCFGDFTRLACFVLVYLEDDTKRPDSFSSFNVGSKF